MQNCRFADLEQLGLSKPRINQGVAMKAFQLAELWQCALCLMQDSRMYFTAEVDQRRSCKIERLPCLMCIRDGACRRHGKD